MASASEQLTQRFYDWELRGRGWMTAPVPLTPGPPFVPFWGHYLDEPTEPVIDDGRQPTVWDTLAAFGKRLFSRQPVPPEAETEDESYMIDEAVKGARLSLVLPPGITYPHEVVEQCLLNLSACTHPVCLEWLGFAGEVRASVSVAEEDAGIATSQLQHHFTEAIVTPDEDRVFDAWDPTANLMIAELGLAEEFMLPLRTYRSFAPDPLTGLVAALSAVRRDELALVQVIFQPVRHPWAASIQRAVLLPDGTPFFANAPEFVKSTATKLASPLYGVVVRVAGQSERTGRDREIVKSLVSALGVLNDPAGNRLFPLDNEDRDPDEQRDEMLMGWSRRCGMVWSLDELASLIHPPGASIAAPALVRTAQKTRLAPEEARQGEVCLGTNPHAGLAEPVYQSAEQRVRHTYVIGASGSGKSTLLRNLLQQDIAAGRGVALLDPHGDLADEVLASVPPERYDDVVLLDLADDGYPVPFNILSAHTDLEKNLLASDLAAAFRRLATSWGDQMTAVLSNAILALLESERGGTLADLRRFLVEKAYRKDYLPTVTDEEVVYYWQHEFPMLTGKPQASVVTRLNTFLRPKPIRYMVAHGDNRLDVRRIMDEQSIFIARIPQGAIGEENAYLLGTLLVSAFHRAALCRQQTATADRKPFTLYIDEFHQFISPSMAQILSGARKYGLGLVLAHQELRQLASRDEDVASAVLTNPATRICFRLGESDARKLTDGMAGFDQADLQNLPTGQAIVRMDRSDHTFNLSVPLPPEVPQEEAEERRDAIRERSRERYAVPRSEVEERLARDRAERTAANEEAKPKRTKKAAPEREEAAPKLASSPPPVPPPAPEPAPPRAKLQPVAAEPEPGTPGRGGQQHKAMQRLIKQWAEGMGFRAQLEKPILEGRGAVDVALAKGPLTIACEISVTTPTAYECHNVAKCLQAGFHEVIMIASDPAHLAAIQARVAEELGSEVAEGVQFLAPRELFGFIESLEQAAVNAGEAKSVRGYRVRVDQAGVDAKRREARMKSITATIAKSALRKKGRGKK